VPSILNEQKKTTRIDWKSFLLGVAATILTIALGASFSFLSRHLKKRRHERELRRIASLDS
jgi:putative Mn2+ efflux pump MntP